MSSEFDTIVIGGGPNGLTTAAYLAQAGLKVLVLDRRINTGGALYTEDFGTPFRYNLGALYMLVGERMRPYDDLGLQEKGVAFVRPEARVGFLYSDDSCLVFYGDAERTAASVRDVSPEDVDACSSMLLDFKEAYVEALVPALYNPPSGCADMASLLNDTRVGKRFGGELAKLSARQVIEAYELKHPRLNAAVLQLASMWGIPSDSAELGWTAPFFVAGMLEASLVRGGSEGIANALYGIILANGGQIREWTPAERILVDGDTAVGVLAGGEEFRSRAVVSTLNPQQTFFDLLGRERVAADVAEKVDGWQWEDWSLFTAHYGIKGGAPHYTASNSNSDIDATLVNFIGIEQPEDVTPPESGSDLPEPRGWVTCTTVHDRLQAATGPLGPLNTLRWEGPVPYDVGSAHWDDLSEGYAQRCLQTWIRYAPNLGDATMLELFTQTPLDIERRWTTMTRGSINMGSFVGNQSNAWGTNGTAGGYRTGIPGLYAAGASVYPGGLVTLAPGHNAAKVVAEDLRAEVWW